MPSSEISPDSAAAVPRTRLDGDSLRAALAAELGISAAELDDDTSLLELGFDSMRQDTPRPSAIPQQSKSRLIGCRRAARMPR